MLIIAALKEHLQQARQHVDQYKAIASSLEQTLAKQNQVNSTRQCQVTMHWYSQPK